MSDTTASLNRKINSAGDLQSVVRAMKALAASSIGQYDKSVHALGDYYRTVELGLGACFRASEPAALVVERKGQSDTETIGAIVFGSDQGLVGQFNEVVADYAIKTLAALPGKPQVWAVGERVYARLQDAGLPLMGLFRRAKFRECHHPRSSGRFKSKAKRTGPRASMPAFTSSITVRRPAPSTSRSASDCCRSTRNGSKASQKSIGRPGTCPRSWAAAQVTLLALIREYLFISLFRACAESLASENASRLAAMQRADKNIDDLLENLHGTFHRLRQSGIDEELFRRDKRLRGRSRDRRITLDFLEGKWGEHPMAVARYTVYFDS